MPHPNKFSPVRAARWLLLLTLSLTVGIGTAIYTPLVQKQAQALQVASAEPRPVTPDTGLSLGTPSDRDSDALDADQESFFGSASASRDNTGPQVVQTTQAPVIASTRGS